MSFPTFVRRVFVVVAGAICCLRIPDEAEFVFRLDRIIAASAATAVDEDGDDIFCLTSGRKAFWLAVRRVDSVSSAMFMVIVLVVVGIVGALSMVRYHNSHSSTNDPIHNKK
jgi:hypothetical protein